MYAFKMPNMPWTIVFTVQMQALHDVVRAGYARYIGMSSCYAWQCMSDLYGVSFIVKC